ncbi:MAG: phosphoribosylformylglycinamidine synthase subunit PurL [Dehalococcoidia bacterium]|jgi:phosphoribosylformylglycinamidine synthase|nr:phosphoribosylformylglycinamidine synthase subunit PurL [Chloroflexota bacterium]MCK4242578.1 phosphoribosylformylglycinamidine synthase subunit PurL [Dehalococcoidia bacterium]
MAHRIEVGFKENMVDALGVSVRKRIIEDLNIPVTDVETIDVYTIDAQLSPEQLKMLGQNLFADPITQVFTCDKPQARGFSWLIEVGFRPGVTDNVGKTSTEAIEDMLKIKVGTVYTSRQYLITGDVSREQVEKIASGLLANQLIERWEIRSIEEWDEERGMDVVLPKVELEHEPQVLEIDLDIGDEELVRLSKERLLVLSLEEMKAIRDYFYASEVVKGREKVGLSSRPTDVELEAIAQTWSEHCKHKIFNALIEYQENEKTIKIDSLFESYIKRSTEEIGREWLVSVFKDNAGVIKFNPDWNVVMKVETHNTPSALDPYAGALTGIVGVNRDPLGTGRGAKLIFNTDVFCFADPYYHEELPPGLLHPKRIFEGVRRGVEHGGNKSGVPTINGSIVFDNRFLGKPLVYCGTCAIMPAKLLGEASHLKKIESGHLAVMCGGRIGKDGIHGATFSSEELHQASPAAAVQIGDPITQKKMSDFLLEARDLGLYQTLTDNGAGGLSSSVGEMAQLSGGCEIFLDRCPLKYEGLDPWEILLSESQERMTLIVPPEKMDDFLTLAKRRGVEAAAVGKFTDSGKFHVFYDDKTVAYMDMNFFHNPPQMKLRAKWRPPEHELPHFEEPEDLTAILKRVLSRLNVCSKEYVVRQYDHEVQGGSVVKPLVGKGNDGPSDAAVIRPLLDSNEGVVAAHGICPKYGDIDTYHMTACAIDEAVRNAISVGASLAHLAGLDNFCWCDPVQSEKNPDGEYKLAQLVRANQALYDYTTAFGVPCISGKDSMKNDYLGDGIKISIPPTILFSVIGKIEDVEKAVTMDAKNAGDMVYVLGITRDELGGSEYYAEHGFVGNNIPKVDEQAIRMYQSLTEAIGQGLIASCHDCSDGGLAVALAETAFAGGLGMNIDLAQTPTDGIKRNDTILFSESQSRFVVTVSPQNKKSFEQIMKGHVFASIGHVTGDEDFVIQGLNRKVVIRANICELKDAWQKTLSW